MTTTLRHPGWTVQLSVHRAVRRDIARLSTALATGQGVSSAAVSAYWAETAFQLHHHHEFEDAVIWPLMRERLGSRVVSLLDRNAEEHRVLAAAIDGFHAVVDTRGAYSGAARDALGRLGEALETHLGHEEADVLPLIPEAFTFEDLAFFKTESAKTNPASAFLPWMLDDAPEDDVAFYLSALPAPVRGQLESDWMPQRRVAVDALQEAHVAAAAPSLEGGAGSRA